MNLDPLCLAAPLHKIYCAYYKSCFTHTYITLHTNSGLKKGRKYAQMPALIRATKESALFWIIETKDFKGSVTKRKNTEKERQNHS